MIRSPRPVTLGLAGIVALAGAHAWFRAFLIDDAYISFRYARNLIDGLGLVYNAGERVEGYTNFLWTLLMAGAMRGGLEPGIASQALGILASSALLVVVYLWGGRCGLSPWWSLLAPAMLAVNRTYAAWATGGLETRLFTLLIAAGAYALSARARPMCGLFFGLAALTRPEGALAILIGLGGIARRASRRYLLVWGIAAMAPPLLHMIWRLSYYGEWLPNSFYAKVPGPRLASGAIYTGLFAWHHLVPVSLVLAAALLAVPRGRISRIRTGLAGAGSFPPAFCVVWMLYAVSVGGDHFEFRFMDPVLPMLYLMAAAFLGQGPAAGTAAPKPALRAGLAALLVAAAGVSSARGFNDVDLRLSGAGGGQYVSIVSVETESGYLDRWRRMGLWLRGHAGPGESIAVLAAGAIPYYSGLPALDMLGINDHEIARLPVQPGRNVGHERGVDAEYARGRGLTYLIDGMAVSATRAEVLPLDVVEVDFGDFFWYFRPLQSSSRIRPGRHGT